MGYPGYPGIPQNFNIYSIKFAKKSRNIFSINCGIPQSQNPNVLTNGLRISAI